MSEHSRKIYLISLVISSCTEMRKVTASLALRLAQSFNRRLDKIHESARDLGMQACVFILITSFLANHKQKIIELICSMKKLILASNAVPL